MSREITGLCREHSFEPAVDLCRICGAEFCGLCLVHPAGKALCKTCAIAAGGVRSTGTLKPLPRRDLKRRLKEFEAARTMRRAPERSTPAISDPLIDYELTDSLPNLAEERPSDPVTGVALDPDLVARAAAQLAGRREAPEDERPADDSPGGDIAPPIDWSKPFG